MADLVGKTILHYKILEHIGQGGMGVVFKAEDTRLKRIAALKFLPPYLTSEEEITERFVHEAQAASALDHANICTIYDVNKTEEGQLFIAMAYYDGETLKDKIDRGPLDVSYAIKIASQIAMGLAKAHREGIVHRDIKPANIIVTEDDTVKIVDFGLAKLSGRDKITKSGHALGTIAYMSPEQSNGEQVDHRTDIWAVGVVIYEMLTGQMPFKGDHPNAVLYSVFNEEPEPLSEIRQDIPAGMKSFMSKALAKDKEKRFQDMDEMLSGLGTLEQELRGDSPEKKTTSTPSWSKALGKSAVWIALFILILIIARSIWPVSPDNPAIDSIAVLPLENLSSDPEEEFFVDGMTETIINELSKISAFRVISRTSAMQYKNTEKSLPTIAGELNVNSVLEGSVIRSGRQVRISAQLIGLSPERQLWANSYNGDIRDILSLSSEVAKSIAKEINITLTPAEERRMARVQSVDPEAHQLYLRGRHQLHLSTTKDYIDKSVDYYNQSIAIDSGYAQAHAGLAEAYIQYSLAGYLTRREAFTKAKAAALEALELDSTNGVAYTYLAVTNGLGEWSWQAAEAQHRRAIELSPGSAITHLHYGYFLTILGRHSEAFHQGNIAQQLDPLSNWINVTAGRFYFYARQYDKAIEEYRKVLEFAPDNIYAQWALAMALERKGQYSRSIATFLGRNVTSPGTNWALGYTYGVAGRDEEADEVLQFLTDLSEKTFITPTLIAYIYIGKGETDKAFEFLEKAYEERETYTEFLKVDPWFDSLRDDPRFIKMIDQMNFPDERP